MNCEECNSEMPIVTTIFGLAYTCVRRTCPVRYVEVA